MIGRLVLVAMVHRTRPRARPVRRFVRDVRDLHREIAQRRHA